MNLARKLIPILKSNKNDIFGDITKFGNLDYVINGSEIIVTPHQEQSAIRLNNIPPTVDFIADFEIQQTISGQGNTTFVYRTSNWGTQGIAYGIGIQSGSYLFGKQNNQGGNVSPQWHSLGTGSLSPSGFGDWIKFKVVVSGASHKIYINDELKIDVIDSEFTGPGQFGLNFYIAEQVKVFRNIKITPII